jgi:hypothetical protein
MKAATWTGAGLIGVIGVIVAIVVALVLGTSGRANAGPCAPGSAAGIRPELIPLDANVAGFGHDQLVNAAAIVSAAGRLGLPDAAQALGVQAAIGEASLRNIDYGDNAINPNGTVADSIGLFQQQSSWGTAAERMDPGTAAGLFFRALQDVPGWENLDPSIAINKVQRNSNPFHYSKSRSAAVEVVSYLASLSGSGGAANCTVNGDELELARQLQSALDAGTLRVQEARMARQITAMADGTAQEGCRIDLPVLQLVALALRHFGTVEISDLNRLCAGSNLGTHAHWDNGGGNAVDFVRLGGRPATGGTPASIELLDLLAAVAPAGTRVGQINCRPAGQSWPGLAGIFDTCDHQHIDFLYADGPLRAG